MTATSGRRLSALRMKSGPLGSLARMLLESSRWFSPARRLKWEAAPLFSTRITYTERSSNTSSKPSAKTSSVKDIPSCRLLFRLVPSERPTDGTGCGLLQGGLLPTPRATEIVEDPEKFVKRNGDRKPGCMPNLSSMAAYRADLLPTPTSIDSGSGRINKSPSPGAKERPTIALAAKMGLLSTPTARDHKNGSKPEDNRTKRKLQQGWTLDLNDMATGVLLPTPNASEGEKYTKKYNTNSQMGKGLTAMAVNALLPTPQTRDYKGECHMTQSCLPNTFQTSQLNPLFVTEMMGFPSDWLVSPFQNGGQKPSKP